MDGLVGAQAGAANRCRTGAEIDGIARKIGCDTIAQLEENVHLAREFTPINDKQATELVARAEPCAKPSLFFRFYDRP